MFSRLLLICVLFSLAAQQSALGCDMMSKHSDHQTQMSNGSDTDSMSENCHEKSEPNAELCKCGVACSQFPSLYTLGTLTEAQALSHVAFDPGLPRTPTGSFVDKILRPPIS